MKRHALARRHARRMPVRKNFLPLVPFAVPLLLGGVAVSALVSLRDKVTSYVSVPAVAGAGVGYIVARAYKQDVKMQVAATAVGYAAGLYAAYWMAEREAKAVAEQSTAQKVASYYDQFHWYNPSTWIP